jgi:hypothetical protein
MIAKGQSEGIHVLDEFECKAIRNPAIAQAPRSGQGRNEGVQVIAELVVELTATQESPDRIKD